MGVILGAIATLSRYPLAQYDIFFGMMTAVMTGVVWALGDTLLKD